LIGNYSYQDPNFAPLPAVPEELERLRNWLQLHFDTIDVKTNLTGDQLKDTLFDFLDRHAEKDARLLIYYSGHSYSEAIPERSQVRGYIAGTDAPAIDGSPEKFDSARRRAISMTEIQDLLVESPAKHVLFIFDAAFGGSFFQER
jgi:hypothetical protein